MDLRLETVCEYVIGDMVCDIGCDHGQLCAELLLNNKIKTAYGVDISPASLQKSRELREKLNLIGFEVFEGNGFEPILHKQIDCGVICGIGSNEVMAIIERQKSFALSLKRLILCPLKNVFLVREYLFKSGFVISDEDLVFENGRYYNIFIAQKGETKEYDDIDIYVGRRLLEKRHCLIEMWLKKRINDMESNINAYDTGVKTENTFKRDNLIRMYNAYKRGLELCR